MKKITILIIFCLNLLPYLSTDGKLEIGSGSVAMAQNYGGEYTDCLSIPSACYYGGNLPEVEVCSSTCSKCGAHYGCEDGHSCSGGYNMGGGGGGGYNNWGDVFGGTGTGATGGDNGYGYGYDYDYGYNPPGNGGNNQNDYGGNNLTGGAGGGNSGYDGGYDGAGIQTPASVAPNATKIFRNSNMIIQTWREVERQLNKILENCLGKALYNALDAALGTSTLIIEFNEKEGPAFDLKGSRIYLDTSGESNRLFHEMWHAYQAYQETESSFNSSKLNQEFESWYAQYQYIKSLPEYKSGSDWDGWYNQNRRGKAVRRFERLIDEKGNLLQGEGALWSYLSAQGRFNSEFRYGEKDDNHVYNDVLLYPYDDARTAAYTFRNLKKLSKDC